MTGGPWRLKMEGIKCRDSIDLRVSVANESVNESRYRVIGAIERGDPVEVLGDVMEDIAVGLVAVLRERFPNAEFIVEVDEAACG